MPDDRIYDAINLFNYSAVGQRRANIGGDDTYKERYRRLSTDIINKLWSLWSRDDIGFHNLGPDTVGDSGEDVFDHDIRVNTLIEPSQVHAIYRTPGEQGKLAATSSSLVHEATHLVRDIESYPEEEILCRTIQLFYIRELMQGRMYGSRFARQRLNAQYTAATPWYQMYRRRLDRLESGDLIDNVFDNERYRRDLESSETVDFISRSLGWWGGLSKRWPSTKGYYLRSLSSSRQDHAESILQILENIAPGRWAAAKACAGDMQRIRDGLRRGYQIYNVRFSRRIQDVQRKLGEDFGMQPRP